MAGEGPSALVQVFALFSGLFGPSRKTNYFLATGETRDTLLQAQRALDSERALLDEIKDHFGARYVMLSSSAEQENWNMGSAQGFKIYFKPTRKPEGWYQPEDWGDRQNYGNARAYLPPEGPAQEYLKQMKIRFDAIQAGPPGRHDPVHDESARSTRDWYYWGNTRARKVLGTPDGFYYSDPAAPGVFVMYFDSPDDNDSPLPPGVSGARISKEDAKLLEEHPDSAVWRANRIEQGKQATTVVERSLARLGRNPH